MEHGRRSRGWVSVHSDALPQATAALEAEAAAEAKAPATTDHGCVCKESSMGALLKAHTNCDEGWCFVREGCAWAEQQQRDWDKCAAPQRSRLPPAPAEPKTEPAHQIVEQAAPTAAQEARPPFERTRMLA